MQQSEPLENPRTQHNVYAISLIFPSSKYKNIKKTTSTWDHQRNKKHYVYLIYLWSHNRTTVGILITEDFEGWRLKAIIRRVMVEACTHVGQW